MVLFFAAAQLENAEASAVEGAYRLHQELVGGHSLRYSLGNDSWSRNHVFSELQRAVLTGRVVVEQVRGIRTRPVPAVPPPEISPPLAGPPSDDTETSWVQVTVVDEVDAPIGNLGIRFSYAGAATVVRTTDAGVARLDQIPIGQATATVASMAELQEILQTRWSAPRLAAPPSGPKVYRREFDSQAVIDVSLQTEDPAILVIMPYYACAEVPGVHFEFGRSYVLSSGIQALSSLSKNLQGTDSRKAILFGHSDRSGSELLNKKLSERRAKSVHALLTHDAQAWNENWTATKDTDPWYEWWGNREAQNMLNALGCGDDDDQPLVEDGKDTARTRQAVKRFQRGDYPTKPAEQAALAETGSVNEATRKELFLAYAKLISRHPVDPARFSAVNGAPYVGCGEYNTRSVATKDAESRRTVAIIYEPVAEPQGLPCKKGNTGPCTGICTPELAEAPADGSPPYRCPVYISLSQNCPCNGGTQLTHDFIVRIRGTLQDTNTMTETYILESEDMSVVQSLTFAADGRQGDDDYVELWYTDLPESLAYRLLCDEGGNRYTVFGYTPYSKLPGIVTPTADVAGADSGDPVATAGTDNGTDDQVDAGTEDGTEVWI